MYTTMEYYDEVFPFIFVNMIKVGELSGTLENSLAQAIKYLEDSTTLNRKIKKILVPNITMFIGVIILLFAGTIIGVPAMQGVFDELGSEDELPAITMWFSGVVDKLIAYWYIPTFLVIGIVVAVFVYIHTPKGKYNFDYFKYTMPVFGHLMYLLDFSRLMKCIALNVQNGIRIQESIELSKSVVKNVVMLSIIEASINNIYIGKSWITPFEEAKLSSTMSTEMLKIGMQTDLAEMMLKMLELIDLDIDLALEKIVKALPQISYAIVGIVLIFFVVVILVPCIQLYMGGFLFSAYGL